MSLLCPECAQRERPIYRADCDLCMARMVARTPRTVAARWWRHWSQNQSPERAKTVSAAIKREREADQAQGVNL